MLKIKDDVDLKELEKFGFYLEGNTYKFDLGEGKCFSVCIINKKIIEPQIEKTNYRFYRDNPEQNLDRLKFRLLKVNLVEKV